MHGLRANSCRWAPQGLSLGAGGSSWSNAQLRRGGVPGLVQAGVRDTLRTLSTQAHAPQVAGMWYSMAMAASDIDLLNTQRAPLRVYIKELKPTPKGDLEVVLFRRWVSRAEGQGAWL